MGQPDIFKRYEQSCVRPRVTDMLYQMESVFQQEKKQFCVRFVKEFQSACYYQRKQKTEMECAYITLEFLRTRLCRQDYRYRIVFFGEDWYLGKENQAGMADLSEIFSLYHKLERELKEDAKQYMGKISSLEVENITVQYLPFFQEYAKELIRYGIQEATEQEEFRVLNKAKELQIRVGECLEPGDLIYMEQKEKDQEKLLNWLGENDKEAYCYQDFRGMDFAGCHIQAHDLRNCDFRDSNLEGADLSLGRMCGAWFVRSRLKGACLSGSILHGADFRKADLRKARMEKTFMYDGKKPGVGWRLVGYPEGSFVEADLREASFRECIYCGADFRGARLEGANFEGAQLYRCHFTDEQKAALILTEEQRAQIEG